MQFLNPRTARKSLGSLTFIIRLTSCARERLALGNSAGEASLGLGAVASGDAAIREEAADAAGVEAGSLGLKESSVHLELNYHSRFQLSPKP